MIGVDLADVAGLARFDVTSPGHHQLAEGGLGALDRGRSNLDRGRGDLGHGCSDRQLRHPLPHGLLQSNHGVGQAAVDGRPLILR